MFELDLSSPATPRLRHTAAAFVGAHTLLSNLGLRVEQWFLETGEREGDTPLYTATIAPLEPSQQRVITAATASPLLARTTPLTDEDWHLIEQVWSGVHQSLFPEGLHEHPSHLDNLFAAVLLPPPGLIPPRVQPPRPPAPKAAPKPAAPPPPAPTAATPASPPPEPAPPPAPTPRPSKTKAKPAPTPPPAPPAPTAAPSPPTASATASDGLDVEKLRTLFRSAFPSSVEPEKGTVCQISVVDVVASEPGTPPRLVLQFFVFESDGKTVRDIKEQECFMGNPDRLADLGRVALFVEGWKQALSEVFRKVGGDPKTSNWMPINLFHIDALWLKNAKTASDFRDALLMRSRLGKLIA